MNKQQNFGAIFSPPDVRDWKGTACASAPADFPEEYELVMPEVKNQGSVGSCVAHAIATTVEYFSRMQGDEKRAMSVGYIYGNRANTANMGKGMITRDAIAATCECGTCVHTLFPYNEEVPEIIERFERSFTELHPKAWPNRFTSYYRVKGEEAIKASLMQNGPVIFAMEWYSDIRVENGIMKTNLAPSNSSSGHCLVIYGWNRDGWKIQNSWGTGWGVGGRAVMPYDIPIREAWGIIDTYSETQRKQRIEELEAKNAELTQLSESLSQKMTKLEMQIDALATVKELSEEQKAQIEHLTETLEQTSRDLAEAKDTVEAQLREIELLRAELVEVKRPYQTRLGRIAAKVINAIVYAFYWLVNKLTKRR